MQNDDLVAPKIMGYGRLCVTRGMGYARFDCRLHEIHDGTGMKVGSAWNDNSSFSGFLQKLEAPRTQLDSKLEERLLSGLKMLKIKSRIFIKRFQATSK